MPGGGGPHSSSRTRRRQRPRVGAGLRKPYTEAMQILLVQDPAALSRLCDRLARSPWVAVDTEFNRESTYYAKLGLLQVGTDEVVACVDPLAVDLAPLLDLLYRPTVLKVLHAGRQDLEVLQDIRRDVPRPLFDTQIAAALVGYPGQIGYASLVNAVSSVNLPKLHTRANWEARPLSEEQIRYAGDDVTYLREVYRRLDARLGELGRSQWLAEECEALANPALYRNEPEYAHTRLSAGHAVAPVGQPLLKALAIWREQTAQARNRPRSWIVSDAALIEIARAAPADRDALGRLPQVPAAVVQRHGDAIVTIVREARAAPPERIWPDPRPPTPAEQALIRQMQQRVNAVAAAKNISAEIIATRRSLFALVRERSGPLSRGWRQALIGEELAGMLPPAREGD